MKCPKCGYISFPGLDRCKKCGRRLAGIRGEAKGVPSLFHLTFTAAKAPAKPDSKTSQDQTATTGQEAGELDIELRPQGAPTDPVESEADKPAPPLSESRTLQDWQTELAERVQEFRERRARLRGAKDDDGETLDLDFGSSAPPPQETHPNVIEFPTTEELERQAKTAPGVRAASRMTSLENFESTSRRQDSGAKSASGQETKAPADSAPLEIELGPSKGNSAPGIRSGATSGVAGALMSARLFAGIIDTLILLSGAAVYTLIFWRTGGRFSLQPLEMGVAAIIGVFFILLYFAGCTVLASATPGLIWAGLEVTTFEGNAPGLSDCLWRAFGYLVSMSALMLGFIWAVVDADGLTWHDRMSRTFVIPVDHQ